MEEKILKLIAQNGEAKVADFIRETGFTRAYIQRFFGKLVDEGKIVMVGGGRISRYVFPETAKTIIRLKLDIAFRLRNLNLNEDKVLDLIKHESAIFADIPENVRKIVDFSFTEILNNAIEHSGAQLITVSMYRTDKSILFHIGDDGIGIFQNILVKRGLKSTLEAIQDLTKGKQTTMPEAHTGQGLFFTARAADKLTIRSSDSKLTFNNFIDDVFLEPSRPIKGTKVRFEIDLDSKRSLRDIFNRYTDKDSFEFTKTDIRVKLYKLGTEYISRSQARRILIGLDDFTTITLDFSKVKSIGQGFADEIFRVWKRNNPKKKIISINMNAEVEFMIKRAGEYK